MGNCLQVPGEAYMDPRNSRQAAFNGNAIQLRNGPAQNRGQSMMRQQSMAGGRGVSLKSGGRPLPQAPNNDDSMSKFVVMKS